MADGQPLPSALFQIARECIRCGTRHLNTPGGGQCRNRQCPAAMPEDGTGSRIVTWDDVEAGRAEPGGQRDA